MGRPWRTELPTGAIPIEKALPMARQIADALEAAHEQGIVHRDLKPANVKIRPDGTVKVLDFGLARASSPRRPRVRRTPDVASPAMTGVGVILGTPAYMSPEQANGKTRGPARGHLGVWSRARRDAHRQADVRR